MTPQEASRVVVTGLGMVTALGADAESTWRGLRNGASGVGRISRFDASGLPSQVAAEAPVVSTNAVPGAPPDDELSVIGRMAIVAAAEALSAAGLTREETERRKTGLSFAAGSGDFAHAEIGPAILAGAAAETYDYNALHRALMRCAGRNFAVRTHTGATLGQLARTFALSGPTLAPLTACAAGTQAVGDAARAIRAGRTDCCIAGGSDSRLFPLGMLGHALLGALCADRNDRPSEASRPFDRSRSGFVAAEGAGVLVLESLAAARRRGAPVLAEIVGFGSTSDAYRATDPHPEGRGAASAITTALAQARLDPDQIGYVNAHGTSTQANDLAESRALHAALGRHAARVPVGSFKSMIGHATAAAGAIELAGTIRAMREGVLPPTINLRDPDPEIDLNVVTGDAPEIPVEYALSNSFGFGGQNAAVIARRWGRE